MNNDIIKLTKTVKKPTAEQIIHACEVHGDKHNYSKEYVLEQYEILFITAIFDLNRQKIPATDENIKSEINNIIFNYTMTKLIEKGLVKEVIMDNGELGYKMA